MTLGDVQAFAAALAAEEAGLRPSSQARALAAVKSLLAFGHRLGYLPFDVGGAVRLPKLRQGLAERILSEAEVHRLLALEPDPRNRALLRLSYAGGLRVSELVALRWRDLQPRGVREGGGEEGQVTVYGKGGKTRTVLLPAPVWADLLALRGRGRAAVRRRRSRTRRCSAPARVGVRGGGCGCARPSAWSTPLPGGRASGRGCRPTGSGTPTPPTPWSAARRSTWSRPRWGTPRWPPPGSTSTPGRPTAARATWPSDVRCGRPGHTGGWPTRNELSRADARAGDARPAGLPLGS